MRAPVTGGGSRQIAPAGTHVARCYQVIDYGTHYDEKWDKRSRKIQFLFELPLETATFSEDKGEQPFYVKASLALSMNEKSNMRKFIQSWLGKEFSDKEAAEFDITSLANHTAMVNIVHSQSGDKTYANIASISPLMKGIQCPPAYNEVMTYDTEAHNEAVFQKLPEFVQDIIRDSDEWKKRIATPAAAPSFHPERKAHASVVDGPSTDFEQPAPHDLFLDENEKPHF